MASRAIIGRVSTDERGHKWLEPIGPHQVALVRAKAGATLPPSSIPNAQLLSTPNGRADLRGRPISRGGE